MTQNKIPFTNTKCDNCKHLCLYKGYGYPDDNSFIYCGKEHWEEMLWEGWEPEKEYITAWDNCPDFQINIQDETV